MVSRRVDRRGKLGTETLVNEKVAVLPDGMHVGQLVVSDPKSRSETIDQISNAIGRTTRANSGPTRSQAGFEFREKTYEVRAFQVPRGRGQIARSDVVYEQCRVPTSLL